MKLSMSRDQAKGLLGGVKFELRAKVDLTAEETELIRRYKVEKEVLVEREMKIPFTSKVLVLKLHIGDLVAGQNFKCADIGEILEYEKNIKDACQTFKAYLVVMKNFGGQEVIEF